MTTPDKADELIEAYLADGPTELPDPSFDAVRGQIERTRQRARFVPASMPAVSDSARLLAVAALVLIAVVGVNLLGQRGQRGVGARTDSASPSPPSASARARSPSPSPSPLSTGSAVSTPVPSVTALDGTLPAGTYRLTDDFPVPATVDLPAGWGQCSNGPYEQAVCGDAEISFMIVDNVVANPCMEQGLDPPVGPTVHDLALAIAALPGFQATAPIDITVDGHPGVEMTVTAPTAPDCQLLTWIGPDRTNGVGASEVNRLRIVDVDGARVLIAAAFHPSFREPDIPANAKQVFESVRFP